MIHDMMQKYEQIMQPAGPQCSCSNNGSDQLATANVNRCSRQHQVGNISDTASASSDLSALVCVCLAVPGDTSTHTRTKAWHADMLTSADVHSADEQATSPLMRGMVDCNSNTASLEQEQNKKATSDEQQKEISVASSDCVTETTTETSVGSLNFNDSRSSSTYLAQNKSEIGKVTEKSSESHPQRSASSPTNDSSSSSTDLLYQALHNRALNDSSSSSSADAETDELLSSQDDEAKALRNKIQNSTQIIRKRKRKRKQQAHPTAQDQSVSSLNSNLSSLSAATTQALYLYDSSSSSTGSPKPKPE